MHHVGATAIANCAGPAGVVVSSWGSLANGSNANGMNDFGAREYLTGVELLWNTADALFPVYRHAVLLFGGRGSAGMCQC
jgi:hypothetical protein